MSFISRTDADALIPIRSITRHRAWRRRTIGRYATIHTLAKYVKQSAKNGGCFRSTCRLLGKWR